LAASSDDLWLVTESAVYDSRTGEALDKAVVQKAKEKEHRSMESHSFYELATEELAKAKGYKSSGAK
jgi:hypothetical protein